MSSLVEVERPHERAAKRIELPRRWHWLIRGFRRYAHRYVRKHFHAVRLSRSGASFPRVPEPLLIVLNHPSWWDPMVCTILTGQMLDREHYAAMDADALTRYAFFKKLGFVGVDTKSLRGAAGFLRTGETILGESNTAFWVTAQGRFADVRQRPLALQSGVGHLAARLSRGIVLPVALEYAFWNERTPEALVRVGEPLRIGGHPDRSGKDWLMLIEESLTRNLDALNAEAISRDPARFTVLLSGKVGVGGPYDLWRRFQSWVRGRTFDPSHHGDAQEARS